MCLTLFTLLLDRFVREKLAAMQNPFPVSTASLHGLHGLTDEDVYIFLLSALRSETGAPWGIGDWRLALETDMSDCLSLSVDSIGLGVCTAVQAMQYMDDARVH